MHKEEVRVNRNKPVWDTRNIEKSMWLLLFSEGINAQISTEESIRWHWIIRVCNQALSLVLLTEDQAEALLVGTSPHQQEILSSSAGDFILLRQKSQLTLEPGHTRCWATRLIPCQDDCTLLWRSRVHIRGLLSLLWPKFAFATATYVWTQPTS